MIGAIDIGGTKIAVGLVSESGAMMAQIKFPTQAERGPHDALERIRAALLDMIAQAGSGLAGIGVGCTGPVDALSGTIGPVPFLPGWNGFALREELALAFGVPVAVENDADAAALGEAAWGAGRGAHRFIFVTVSTGIGGGLMCNERLYRGVDGSHPEIGHHIIDPSGPLCSCGARGCWESLASGLALADWYTTRTAQTLDARAVCEAAERGERHALEAVAREGYYLGLGLSNLIALFAPEVIALGGGLMHSRHLFWENVQATIRDTCRLTPHEKVRLVPAVLGREAGLLGAACAWLHRSAETS